MQPPKLNTHANSFQPFCLPFFCNITQDLKQGYIFFMFCVYISKIGISLIKSA